MELIETEIFTKYIVEMMSDDEYMELQGALIEKPSAGRLIPGGYGLRKLRWGIDGGGKRGGLRIIYYFFSKDGSICLLLAYKKSEQKDVTRSQLKMLSNYVKEWVYGR